MEHPTHAEPTPPFPEQEQEPPGREAEMQPLADRGEDTYVGHGRLKDRVALITGADSGIGRAVAIAFAREGADVLITHLEAEKDDAQETVGWVTETGQRGSATARHHPAATAAGDEPGIHRPVRRAARRAGGDRGRERDRGRWAARARGAHHTGRARHLARRAGTLPHAGRG